MTELWYPERWRWMLVPWIRVRLTAPMKVIVAMMIWYHLSVCPVMPAALIGAMNLADTNHNAASPVSSSGSCFLI